MLADALRERSADDGPTIVCAQAGEVNTGAFDPFDEIADARRRRRRLAARRRRVRPLGGGSRAPRTLVAGVERADSWATDGHKWLNVPYDCGIVFCAHPEAHRAAMSRTRRLPDPRRRGRPARPARLDAGVLATRPRLPRLRGDPLARPQRLAELVERCCDLARALRGRIAELPGAEVLNDVVLNQVLFRFDSDERTDRSAARASRRAASPG